MASQTPDRPPCGAVMLIISYYKPSEELQTHKALSVTEPGVGAVDLQKTIKTNVVLMLLQF